MVILITSKDAYTEMKDKISNGQHPVWLSNGILSQEEINSLWEKDVDLSVFNYQLDTNDTESLDCALDTIKEHYPGQNIWVQYENKI